MGTTNETQKIVNENFFKEQREYYLWKIIFVFYVDDNGLCFKTVSYYISIRGCLT